MLAAGPAVARHHPEIAFTFDDLPAHSMLPPGVSRIDVGRSIAATLQAAGIPARGFVNGGQIDRAPAVAPVLDIWVAAGLPLGNHGWNHANVNTLSLADNEAEISRNEALLARTDPHGDWHWFRFPFLAEGDDPAMRLAIRAVLKQRGYRIAAVTMSFADYAYNEPYARCMARGDTAMVARLERQWLAAARHQAKASRTMAYSLHGRDIPYVLLMHLGAFDAHMLPRLVAQYRHDGFRFISLDDAERDPAYAADVDLGAPPQPLGLEGRMSAMGKAVPPPPGADVVLDAACR